MTRALPPLAAAAVLGLCAIPLARASAELKTVFAVVSGDGAEFRRGEDWLPAVRSWRHEAWPEITGAAWIWNTRFVTPAEAADGTEIITFRERFNTPKECSDIRGTLQVSADNAFVARLNGVQVSAYGKLVTQKTMPDTYCCPVQDVDIRLKPGPNVLEVDATSYGYPTKDPKVNPAGVSWRVDVTCAVSVP